MRSHTAREPSSRSTATASTIRPTRRRWRASGRRGRTRSSSAPRLHDAASIPRARYLANRFACFWISWASGHPIADSQSGFRVYPAEVMEIALGERVRGGGFTFESEILIEAARRGHPTRSVKMAARYPAGARASHYRAVADTAKIVVMVGGRLLRRGLYPIGLWNSLRRDPHDLALLSLPTTRTRPASTD